MKFNNYFDNRGMLAVFDNIEIPFNIKRFFFIECNLGFKRGNHYHKNGTQLIYVLDGEISANISYKDKKTENLNLKSGNSFLQTPFCKFEFSAITQTAKLIIFCDSLHNQNDYYEDYNE